MQQLQLLKAAIGGNTTTTGATLRTRLQQPDTTTTQSQVATGGNATETGATATQLLNSNCNTRTTCKSELCETGNSCFWTGSIART